VSRMAPESSKRQPLKQRETHELAAEVGLPVDVAYSAMVGYRSFGIGVFGVFMRFLGMPLEKIALYMNSSQVSGKNPFQQAIRLTFDNGALSPWRVVGPASITAWLFQYSVMGFAFQFFDNALSRVLQVKPVAYGSQLMEPPTRESSPSLAYSAASAAKTIAAPAMSGALESAVSNRAEVQRYFGPERFANIESKLNWGALSRHLGPAFIPNATRNIIMCNTSFVLTPITYKLYFPQEKKSTSTLFWYGLGMNIFVGNIVAISQQAFWGRSLDYCAVGGGRNIVYSQVVRDGLKADGLAAFFTPSKWFSRVLMNAPAQGVLPWFYNEVLPVGERRFLSAVTAVYRLVS